MAQRSSSSSSPQGAPFSSSSSTSSSLSSPPAKPVTVGMSQGRVVPDFRTTAALVGPPSAGRSTVFRRLMAELQQASDPLESEGASNGLLRVDYDGRRALIKLSDYASDRLENFLCEGREYRNPYDARVFVIVVSLRCDGLMGAPICSGDGSPPSTGANGDGLDEGPTSSRAAPQMSPFEAEKRVLKTIEEWHARACEHSPAKAPSFLIVGTAMDLPKERRLSPEPLAAWAREKGAIFAATGLNFPHGLLFEPFSRAVASALALNSYPVMRRGYLVKQGAWMRNWKRRLFVLEQEGRLRYYADDRDEAKGTIDVVAARRLLSAEECHTNWPPKADMDACFGVELAGRTYYFIAPDPASAKAWQRDLASLATSPDFCLPLAARSGGAKRSPGITHVARAPRETESRVDGVMAAPADS